MDPDIPWICASDEGKRYSIYRGYVPSTKGNGGSYVTKLRISFNRLVESVTPIYVTKLRISFNHRWEAPY